MEKSGSRPCSALGMSVPQTALLPKIVTCDKQALPSWQWQNPEAHCHHRILSHLHSILWPSISCQATSCQQNDVIKQAKSLVGRLVDDCCDCHTCARHPLQALHD